MFIADYIVNMEKPGELSFTSSHVNMESQFSFLSLLRSV